MSSVKKISYWKLIKYFFCPPCPRQVAEKIAFLPPSPPSYEVVSIDERPFENILQISPDIDANGMKKVLRYDVRFIKTALENDIVVIFLKCVERTRFTLIYSHGNAVDIGHIINNCVNLSLAINCDIVTYDYSGYGQSKGKSSEENLYADIKAAWTYTLNVHEPNPDNVILYGQSLGTAATLDLASKISCGGVILLSPMTSAFRVACGDQKCCGCLDAFNKYIFL